MMIHWCSRQRLRWKLYGAFSVVLAIMAAQGALAYWASLASAEAANRSEQTHITISTANEALATLVSMQTGYRGFLLTGQDPFLEPYTAGLQTYPSLLQALQVESVDPRQRQLWAEVIWRADDWVRDSAAPSIALRRSLDATGTPVDVLIDRLQSGAGKAQFDALRAAIAEAIAGERRLLAERNRESGGAAQLLQNTLLWGTAAAAALALVVATLLERSLSEAMGQVAAAARQVAQHDLPALVNGVARLAASHPTGRIPVTAQHIPVRGGGELAEMTRDTNLMIDRLHEAGREVDELTRTVDSVMRQAASERDFMLATLEAAQDGVLITDVNSNPMLTNQRYDQWFGISKETLPYLSLRERRRIVVQRVEEPKAYLKWTSSLMADPKTVTVRRIRLAGSPLHEIDCFTAPVRSTGAHIGRVFIYHDVTREMEAARTKDELVSVVSHELRTPLASLVGFAELLLSRDYAEAQRRQFLTVMVEEGRRLTALINDFLDLQRMETGRQQLTLAPTALRPLLLHAAASAQRSAALPIAVDAPNDLPLVRADADRVTQVLVNLLSNAQKYSPNGGEVRIAARSEDGIVTVSVSDHGLGIPLEALPRLFEKFYSVDNSDRRSITGTGLGLAISQHIIAAHGGRIWAESPGLGQGATISFTLPILEAAAARGDVLVVEDDASFARLLEAELAGLGLTAVRVTSAEEAWELIAAHRPRALLLDLMLPGVQGETFLQRLHESGAPLPVIVVSMKDLGIEERQALLRLGAVEVLQKGPGVAALAASAVGRALAPSAALMRRED